MKSTIHEFLSFDKKAMSKKLLSLFSLAFVLTNAFSQTTGTSGSWDLNGNFAIDSTIPNFVGTKDL